MITLAPVGTPPTSTGIVRSVNGLVSGRYLFTVPTQTGQYEFRYLLANYTIVATCPLTVGTGPLPLGISCTPPAGSVAPLHSFHLTPPSVSIITPNYHSPLNTAP